MFIALYEMTAKPGRELDFEKAWADFTIAIHRVRGSLGSRLHTTETPGSYIAYAQWPSKSVFEDKSAESGFSAEDKEALARMKDSVTSIRLLHGLEVKKDLLK